MQPVWRQWVGKHIPMIMNIHAAIELLLEMVFYTPSLQRGCKEGIWGDPLSWELSSARDAEKEWHCSSVDNSVVGYSPNNKDVSTEAEESPFMSAVTKQWLVKTLQAGEDLAYSGL
jgi:hypothetical protein